MLGFGLTVNSKCRIKNDDVFRCLKIHMIINWGEGLEDWGTWKGFVDSEIMLQ